MWNDDISMKFRWKNLHKKKKILLEYLLLICLIQSAIFQEWSGQHQRLPESGIRRSRHP